MTKTEKLNDSDIKTIFSNIKPIKSSRFKTNIDALTEAKTEYLFLLK